MQTQQRAEAGVREIIIGYVGHEDDADLNAGAQTLTDVLGAFEGVAIESTVENLPEEIRAVYLAEMMRLKTGEIRKSADFRTREGI
jgi:hypothetical protein